MKNSYATLKYFVVMKVERREDIWKVLLWLRFSLCCSSRTKDALVWKPLCTKWSQYMQAISYSRFMKNSLLIHFTIGVLCHDFKRRKLCRLIQIPPKSTTSFPLNSTSEATHKLFLQESITCMHVYLKVLPNACRACICF